jgi:two-component system sensor histidine kinase/response regulator
LNYLDFPERAAISDSLNAHVAASSVAAAGPVRSPVAGPVDVDAALARLGGNAGLYQQIYRMFRVDAGSMVGQLANLVATGRRQEAQRMSHTLKGLGATMGATVLAAAAERAEAAMAREARDEDACLLANTSEAFAQACFSIEQALAALSGSQYQSCESSEGI